MVMVVRKGIVLWTALWKISLIGNQKNLILISKKNKNFLVHAKKNWASLETEKQSIVKKTVLTSQKILNQLRCWQTAIRQPINLKYIKEQ